MISRCGPALPDGDVRAWRYWCLRASLELAAQPSAVPGAREHVRQTMRDWDLPEHLCAPMALLTSELVTNAVKASRSVVQLWLFCDLARVMVMTWDPSPEPPKPAEPGTWAEEGRGLMIVAAMSDRWGWHPVRDGKIVYAVIDL